VLPLTSCSIVHTSHCKYTLEVYPSAKLESRFTSNQHIAYALVVVSIFFALLILLLIYDCMVTRRQRILMSSAERTNALVSSLFPETVQKRIMDDAVQSDKVSRERTGNNMFGGDVNNESTSFTSRPIADLFPNTTVLFADIAGFTSWSSAREPAQVFVLLETIYQAFDKIAKRRRVFKVETIGDCYVAVVGLPAPRKDHAVVMARFAQDCLSTFSMLVKQMEVTLGPDTGELALRTGLHSGPVTAGVLRGEKSRFQLFGDTVNTTARIETSGVRNQIHISQETADLLKSAGKEHWIRLREDRVVAKGKGELVTYWMEPKVSQCRQSSCGGSDRDEIALESIGQDANESSTFDDATKSADTRVITSRFVEKQDNLIQWNTDMLSNLLKGIMARRHDCGIHPSDLDEIHALEHDSLSKHHSTNRMEEAEETIHLPGLATASREHSIELSEAVTSQLLSFVHTIADMYPDNPFHNFEHASHVTMSVQKLLCRIVAQSDTEAVDESHHRSYGITSDPLIHFAIVLSALIHDVDHPGVPNATLVQEKSKLAAVYKNKSIAEQNSIDLAWDLLMDDSFVDLRRALYTTTDEFLLLRKLVTKSVVATDIMDKQLGACRKARWAKAFEIKNEDTDVITGDEYQKDDHDRKATIVLEHVIQASDVAHTMQHWQIYIKWNERLFHEMYRAFLDGRSSQDPSENWYSNELGFFDFYLIPLANKLESCGCFGVSGIEYLNYVTKNRREWESNGKEAVARYLETYSVSSGL
jgi:class 3 adenylate cyclase